MDPRGYQQSRPGRKSGFLTKEKKKQIKEDKRKLVNLIEDVHAFQEAKTYFQADLRPSYPDERHLNEDILDDVDENYQASEPKNIRDENAYQQESRTAQNFFTRNKKQGKTTMPAIDRDSLIEKHFPQWRSPPPEAASPRFTTFHDDHDPIGRGQRHYRCPQWTRKSTPHLTSASLNRRGAMVKSKSTKQFINNQLQPARKPYQEK